MDLRIVWEILKYQIYIFFQIRENQKNILKADSYMYVCILKYLRPCFESSFHVKIISYSRMASHINLTFIVVLSENK